MMKIRPLISIKVICIWVLIILLYIIAIRQLQYQDFFIEIISDVQRESVYLTAIVFSVILIVSLLIPFSAASALVLIGVQIFGPSITLLLSFSSGLVAAFVSYRIGRFLPKIIKNKKMQDKYLASVSYLEENKSSVYLATFLVRCVPNPLYDVWGYSCGAMKVSFPGYFLASAFGGIIPISILCYLAQ